MSEGRLQRVGPLAALPGLVDRHGVEFERVVEGTELTAATVADPDALISFRAACGIIDRAVALTGRPQLGLELGLLGDHGSLGVVGRLIAEAPTLGEALYDFVRNQHRNSRGAVVFLLPQGDSVHLGYGIYDRYEPGANQVYDIAVGVGVNMVRRLAGRRAALREVLLCHRGNAPRQLYEQRFGCTVRLNQPYAALVLSADAMRLPIEGGDPALRRQLGKLVEAAILIGALDFASHVRHILKPGILLGEASSERIARRIGVHLRTLNRRLKDEGTSFRAIEQEVRFAIACELLSLTDLDVADISETLAYSTTSAFDRAFRRWSGISPTAWRKAHAAPAPG